MFLFLIYVVELVCPILRFGFCLIFLVSVDFVLVVLLFVSVSLVWCLNWLVWVFWTLYCGLCLLNLLALDDRPVFGVTVRQNSCRFWVLGGISLFRVVF